MKTHNDLKHIARNWTENWSFASCGALIREKKRYSLAPIVFVLLLGLFVLVSSTVVAPFIYTLFLGPAQ